MKKFLLYHLPFIGYALVITTLSSISSLPTPSGGWFFGDKGAHFIEYALFAFFTYRSFSNISKRISPRIAILISAIFLITFAFLDEYLQKFIPGRTSDPLDILSDSLGAILVLSVLLIILIYRTKRDKQK